MKKLILSGIVFLLIFVSSCIKPEDKDAFESRLNYPDSYIKLLRLLSEHIGNLLNMNDLASDIKLDGKNNPKIDMDHAKVFSR